jgi:hypothetical protein
LRVTVCLFVCGGECSAANGRGERISGQTVVRRDLGQLDCVFIGANPDATSTCATRHGTLLVVSAGSEKEERGGVAAIVNSGPATWHDAAVETMTLVNKSDAAVSGRRVCERGQAQPAASCIALTAQCIEQPSSLSSTPSQVSAAARRHTAPPECSGDGWHSGADASATVFITTKPGPRR